MWDVPSQSRSCISPRTSSLGRTGSGSTGVARAAQRVGSECGARSGNWCKEERLYGEWCLGRRVAFNQRWLFLDLIRNGASVSRHPAQFNPQLRRVKRQPRRVCVSRSCHSRKRPLTNNIQKVTSAHACCRVEVYMIMWWWVSKIQKIYYKARVRTN